ncbi:MAG: flippase-like domain-containing protein [Planctomycetaceae bacterium]|nr:flippase-like domain-containing protein [Planctomycetaceae bacterium]
MSNPQTNSDGENRHRKPFKKIAMTFVRWGIILLVMVWVIREVVTTGRDVANYQWTLHIGWMLVAVISYLIGYLPAGIYWHIVLRKLGQKPTLYRSLRAYYIGHLGKYIPGKAMVVAIRAGLVRDESVKTSVAVVCVFLETLTMMAVGAMISAILLIIFFHDQTRLMLVAVGLMIVSGLPVTPFFFRKLVRIAGLVKTDEETLLVLNKFDAKLLLCGIGLMVVTWFFLGVSLCTTICGVGISLGDSWFVVVQHLPRFITASALSTVAGFLSMIPGGFGVREMILYELMQRYFNTTALPTGLSPRAAGLVVASVTRLVSILSELVLSIILYAIRSKK